MAREESLRPQVTVETYEAVDPVHPATMPWWVAGIGGALVSAVVGWVLVTALVLIAQLAAIGEVAGAGLSFSTKVWLLAHGGAFRWEDTTITLMPLGFTALIAFVIHGAAGYAGRQAILADVAASDGGPVPSPAQATWKVTGVVAGTYAALVAVTALLLDPAAVVVRSGFGALVLALVAGFFGARKAAKWEVWAHWPVWARAIPRAMTASVLIALIGGAVALIVGMVVNREQFIMLTHQLSPGWAGGIVLACGQLFFIGTFIIWGTTWTFGPGFSLGDDSLITLAGGHLGMLPALPITAALPTQTPSEVTLIWLAVPVLSGAGAALAVLRARPRARFDETALVGGLSGVLSGLVIVVLALVARGDLGNDRLTDLGPQVLPLLIIAPSVMGIGGMLTGLVAGLARRPAGPTDARWWSRWGGASGGASEKKAPKATATKAQTSDHGEPTQEMTPPVVEEQPAIDFHADKW